MSEFRRYLLGLAVALATAGFLGASAPATAAAPGGATKSADDVVLRGDAVCEQCHKDMTPHILEIGQTPMGTTADLRTPTCTSCHGESLKHRQGEGMPDRTFDKKSTTPVAVRNEACLACHQKDDAVLSHWAGSTHQLQNLACTSCHQVHVAHDPVLGKRTQPKVCFTCHKEQRAQVNRPSHHPIPEGKVTCSDCHSPMGSVGPHLLKRASVNDTCYTCHMEKRGPFVHNHEPVTEDCTNCHNPHGTVVENMLKMRPPMLCHQCHSPHGGYPLQLLSQQGITGSASLNSSKQGVTYTMGRGCLNCHTQIHGTNNPAAGATLNPTPQFLFR